MTAMIPMMPAGTAFAVQGSRFERKLRRPAGGFGGAPPGISSGTDRPTPRTFLLSGLKAWHGGGQPRGQTMGWLAHLS